MRTIALEARKLARSLAVLAAVLLPAFHAAPAHAQNNHSWVSHGGNLTNNCLSSSPCANFPRTMLFTNDGGEISCLDSGSFEPIAINISVTINCSGTVAAPMFDTGNNCNDIVTINAPGKVVTLRGLDINGVTGSICPVHGINIQAAAVVNIEDCVIENTQGAGILDQRATGLTKLVIKNTIVRNSGSAGIVAGAAAKGLVVLENVQSVQNTFGIAVATGNNVVISRSVMSENSVAGIEADPGATVVVESTKISHNASYGIYALGSVTLANSDIDFNSTSISGSTFSFGNNRLVGNGPGTAPTLLAQQ